MVVVSEVMPEVMAEVVGRPVQPLFVLSQVNNRLRNELGLFSLGVTQRTEIPQRTDVAPPVLPDPEAHPVRQGRGQNAGAA